MDGTHKLDDQLCDLRGDERWFQAWILQPLLLAVHLQASTNRLRASIQEHVRAAEY